MGAMQNLRNNMHIILWAVLILFLLSMTIGGLVGGADILDILSGKARLKGQAGVVNGHKLEGMRFDQLVQNELARIRENGQDIDEMTVKRTSDQIWTSFVNETLVSESINQYKLVVSDHEILRYLQDYPPDFLRQNDAFLTNGQFDYQKYYSALTNPQGDEWLPVEQYIRATLPFQKIANLIQNLTMVSDQEIENDYILNHVKFSLETLQIPFAIVANDSFDISAGELQQYYRDNKKDFFVPETRLLDYVQFEIKPSPMDTASALELALNIRERILHGESFETLAAEYTKDPSGKKSGGDLGWFGRDQMVEPFTVAAFGAQIGEITQPVLTRFGYHLIKVEERRRDRDQDQVKARHILIGIDPGPETIDNLRNRAGSFNAAIGEFGFEEAAEIMNLEIKTTSPLRKEDLNVRGLGGFQSAVRFAFAGHPLNTVSEILASEKSYALFRLKTINPEHYKPLDEEKEQITRNLLKTKRLAKLNRIGIEVHAAVASQQNLQIMIEQYPQLRFAEHSDVTLNRPLKGLTRSNQLTGVILALQAGQISRPISLGNDLVIVRLVARAAVDENHYAVEKEVQRDKMLKRKQSTFYNTWVNALSEQAKIIDNREYMYAQ